MRNLPQEPLDSNVPLVAVFWSIGYYYTIYSLEHLQHGLSIEQWKARLENLADDEIGGLRVTY